MPQLPAPGELAPARVRVDAIRTSLDMHAVAYVVFAGVIGSDKIEIREQHRTSEQLAALIATAMRFAADVGVFGRAMEIFAATRPNAELVVRDARMPNPGEIPPDDMPPHLRG